MKDRSQNEPSGSQFPLGQCRCEVVAVNELSDSQLANSQLGVNAPGQSSAAPSQEPMELVLSLFPGIDIFGRGFEDEGGFCVVRGPDLIYGGDIRRFDVPVGALDGVIGGPPCQDFSLLRRDPPTGYGLEMLGEFVRIVKKAKPMWWLMENVAGVPDVKIDGYSWQRLDVRASEFGLNNRRLRHFQWGSLISAGAEELVLPREDSGAREPIALASKGGHNWPKFLQKQGLPPNFQLPGMTREGRRRAVGNAVAYPVARAMAKAVKERVPAGSVPLCKCLWGRPISGKQESATDRCRKRFSLRAKKLKAEADRQ